MSLNPINLRKDLVQLFHQYAQCKPSHKNLGLPWLFLVHVSINRGVPVDTGRNWNVHKTFRRRSRRLLNVLRTFNLRPVSTGLFGCLANICNGVFARKWLAICSRWCFYCWLWTSKCRLGLKNNLLFYLITWKLILQFRADKNNS